MSPGPSPDPTSQRGRDRERQSASRARGELVALRSGETLEIPPPQASWVDVVKNEWSTFWKSDLATLVTLDAIPALERLFTLRSERALSYAAVRDSNSRLIRGSQGQMVRNPLTADIQAYDAEIRQLEDRFGLTPLARLKVAHELGDAHQSLDAMNARFEDNFDEDDEDEDDPRRGAIDV